MTSYKRGLTDEELRKILEEDSESENGLENFEMSDSDEGEEDVVVEENTSDEEDNISTEDIVEDELDISENEMTVHDITPENLQYTARDGTVWNKNPPPQSRIRSANVLNLKPGPTTYAIQRTTNSPISSMKLFLTDKMMRLLLLETNRERSRVCSEKGIQVKEISLEELEAFIGLLLLAGVHKSAGESLKELWSNVDGRPIFRATMSLKRFCNISRFLRFDNKEDRPIRRRHDKLAPIRDFFDLFVAQLPKMFVPYENGTVDEQLVPFRGNCPFRQYIPTKPRGKYGIKLWLLSDVKTAYVYSAEVYTGKVENQPREVNQGRNVVLRLVKNLEQSGRNITTDNFFTDHYLATELLKRKLTLIGTLRKNKTFIPVEFQPHKKRETFSSIFGFQKNMTLVSYTPKKGKAVVLLSSMHLDGEVSSEEHKKPAIILDYNKTKGGVDTTDKLASAYTCKRGTRRWPVCLFYNILDLAYVVHMHVNPQYNANKLYKRRLFLKELGYSLTEKCRNIRMAKNIPQKIKANLRTVAGTTEKTEEALKRGRCKDYGWKKDRKTRTKCQSCNFFVCPEHVNTYCNLSSTKCPKYIV